MTLTTGICGLLGVEHPVGNAGMAGVAMPELCAAVAEAGGIGTVAMGRATPDEVTARAAAVRVLTDRPFSANFIAWAIEGDSSPLDAAVDAGVSSITLSFGDPGPYVERVHKAGALLINQVQTVEDARRAVDVGADVLIAQGNEAGGHTGVIPLMPFLPQVVDVAGGIPVLAAGGIGDGRGLAAVLMLGGQGVLMGTRFILADEATSEWPELPDQVLAASADDTVWTTAIDVRNGGGRSLWPQGIGARSIRTPWIDRWAGREPELAERITSTDADVDGDATPAYAGPIAGMFSTRMSAASIVNETIASATKQLRAASEMLSDHG